MTFPDIINSKVRQAATLIVLASFVFTTTIAAAATDGGTSTTVTSTSASGRFTTDLTQLGHHGRLRQNLSLDSETSQLIRVLGKGSIQPVIVNYNRETQDTIVEQLALRNANGSVPGTVKGGTILEVETDVLFSNVRSDVEAAAAIDAASAKLPRPMGVRSFSWVNWPRWPTPALTSYEVYPMANSASSVRVPWPPTKS